jgi:hypothetical protein
MSSKTAAGRWSPGNHRGSPLSVSSIECGEPTRKEYNPGLRRCQKIGLCHAEPFACHSDPALREKNLRSSLRVNSAKHLHYLESKRMQILRSAQDDKAG